MKANLHTANSHVMDVFNKTYAFYIEQNKNRELPTEETALYEEYVKENARIFEKGGVHSHTAEKYAELAGFEAVYAVLFSNYPDSENSAKAGQAVAIRLNDANWLANK